MATKDHCKYLKDKHDSTSNDSIDVYRNFNLNKNHKCTTAFVQKRSKSVEIGHPRNSNYVKRTAVLAKALDVIEKTASQKDSISLKKFHKNLSKNYFGANLNAAKKEPATFSSSNKSSSTLSLHIAAYENFVETQISDMLSNDELRTKVTTTTASKNTEQKLIGSSLNNRFEFPRQQESSNESKKPEVQQFTASQRLFTPVQQPLDPPVITQPAVVQPPGAKVSLDFHNSDAVRCLTEKLLKEDFELDVILPADALVPRIPQRLDYILLVQDLLNASNLRENILGIDIGTGPSCVYPLLGAKHCHWNFCATEVNEESAAVALKNVEQNDMNDKITIFQSHESSLFKEIFEAYPDKIFTFSMCNPPFFNKEECEERFQRSDKSDFKNNPSKTDSSRAPPLSSTVARSSELWVHGGEVDFVTRMIHESSLYPDKVQLYTSMIGKKISILPLKKVLEECKNLLYATHCIAQGKTKRWILVWTFNPAVKVNVRLVVKTLSFSKNNQDVISFFCQICKWANIEVMQHSTGYLLCLIPSSKISSFTPWKSNNKRKSESIEVSKKYMKLDPQNTKDRNEVNSNLNNESKEVSQLSNEVISSTNSDDRKLPEAKNIRLVVNRKENSSNELNVEFYTGDISGFKWIESLINYVQGNLYLLNNG